MSQIILPDSSAIPKPGDGDIAKRGARRLVKLIPLPSGFAVPAIWTGPIKEDEIENQKVIVRDCIVLITKEPKAETMRVTVPKDFYDSLPDVPVEW